MPNMNEDKRKGISPIPANLKNALNKEQLFMLNKMEGFGWTLNFVRRPLFQDVVPVLVHNDSGQQGVLEDDGTLNTRLDIKIRD
jgi:hypothetical protein